MRRSRTLARAIAAVASLALTAAALTACAPDAQVTIDMPEQAEGALPADLTAQLEEAVTAAMTVSGASGAIVGVWAPWSGSWVQALGTDAAGAPLDVGMGFRVADLTRLMTCDALYSVAADGLVELDDPVTDYVVGVPDLDGVTLKHLCDGSAGLGSSEAALRASWMANPARQWRALELASFGLAVDRTAPGVAFRDSDAGYVLLGMALERATGQPARTVLEERVFAPLQLADTKLPPARAAQPTASGGTLTGYRYGLNAEGALDCTAPVDASLISASIGYTDSGVVSTVTDLGRYLRALGAGALVDTEAAAERFAGALPQSAEAPGWYNAAGGGYLVGSLIGQHGWMPGYLSAGYVDPETGMTVVVVLNNSQAGANIIAYLAWQLAALASKAPAAAGHTAPDFGLPFTAEQYRDAVAVSGIACG